MIQSSDIILCNNIVQHDQGQNLTYSFVIPSYYQITGYLGIGGYGVVFSALDTRTNEEVAIKKFVNVFEQNKDDQKRILREVKILKYFCGEAVKHKNILHLVDLIPPFTFKDFRDLYFVTPLMTYDLGSVTESPKTLKLRLVKLFTYQILEGICHLHKMGIVHRDLKPANILVNDSLELKICDFGLSRGHDEGIDFSCTYVVTRYYRSPELCLAWKNSSFSCDIWSVGCILAELLAHPKRGKNKVLFEGKSSYNQIIKIFKVLGKPKELLFGSKIAKQWVQKNIPDNCQETSLEELFSHVPPEGLDLLKKCLTIDPRKRIKPEEALNHPFLEEIVEIYDGTSSDDDDEDDEKEEKEEEEEEENEGEDNDSKKKKFSFRFDEKNFPSSDDIKKEMYREVRRWYSSKGFKGKILYSTIPVRNLYNTTSGVVVNFL